MIINNIVLNNLSDQAKANPRLRQSLDLRNSDTDMSQRMLNAIEPGSEMPIHRHKYTSDDNSAMNVPSRAFSNVPSVTDSNVPLQMWLL